jgi:hypothetical protein
LDVIFQQVLNALTLGGAYGLVALGLTLVYGILHVPNFAHGAFYMAGAYVAFCLMGVLGFNYWIAMAGAAVAVAALTMVAERLVFHPLRHAPGLHHMIAAIGILLFLELGAQAIRGADFHRMQTPFTGILNFASLVMPVQRVFIVIAAFTLLGALHLFPKKTVTGATILAMAQNRDGAALVGIDPNRVAMLTFAISGGRRGCPVCAVQPGVPRHGAFCDHQGLRNHPRWHGQRARCDRRRADPGGRFASRCQVVHRALPQAQSRQGSKLRNFAELLRSARGRDCDETRGHAHRPGCDPRKMDKGLKSLPAENNPNDLDGVTEAGGILANTYVGLVDGGKVKALNLRNLSASK